MRDDGWKPIRNAPNGQILLVKGCTNGPPVQIAMYQHTGYGRRLGPPDLGQVPWVYDWVNIINGQRCGEPTHWRHLPSADSIAAWLDGVEEN